MRRTTPLIAVVGLALALVAPPAGATSGTMIITTDTTLTEDHAGSIEIAADDITLDCAGFTVSGPDLERGISVDGHSGVIVENCLVTGFFHGIVVINGSSNTVRGNITYANDGSGIVVQTGATGTRVIGNRSHDNADWGFQLGVTGGNIYRHNEAWNNLGGFAWDHGRDDLVVGNVARRNQIVGFGMGNSSNITFLDNVARNNAGPGFEFSTSVRIVLKGNRSLRNTTGFRLVVCDHNVLRSNVARRNKLTDGEGGHGFETADSDRNLFEKNRATANFRGFVLWMQSNHNTYVRNVACHNRSSDAMDEHSGTGNVWRNNRFCNADL